MSVLAQFGVDAAELSANPQGDTFPAIVAGRVAHIDADFTSYQVSAESADELDPDHPQPRKTLDDMKHNAVEAVEFLRKKAGAERSVLHVTVCNGLDGDKGGRGDQAILRPYQAQRTERETPEHRDAIRAFLGNGLDKRLPHVKGQVNSIREADDGMAMAQYASPENTIIASADKDLLMVPGWKLDMNTLEIWKADAFGHLEVKVMKSGKKVVGSGSKFFWWQLLAGDPADNISGLPALPATIAMERKPTKEYSTLYERWVAAEDTEKADALEERMNLLAAGTKKCGAITAYELLNEFENDKQCYNFVRRCYNELDQCAGFDGFIHHRTRERVSPMIALFSEMQLLWMRRTDDHKDVLNFIKEKCL